MLALISLSKVSVRKPRLLKFEASKDIYCGQMISENRNQPGAYLRAVLSLVPKDFALTVEQADYPQYIELRFTDTPD